MIVKNRLKRFLAQLIALAAVLIIFGVLALSGRIALYSLSGAKTAQALHEVPEVPESAQDHVTWLPDEWSGQRQLEPGTRRQIEAAYVQAWEALGRYPETGDPAPVTEWFAGPARQQVLDTTPSLRREVWGIHFRLALTFYSLDGATLSVRDEGATVVRSLRTANGETVITSAETYQTVLTMEDGYWRIRQLRQVSSRPLVQVSSTTATAPSWAERGPTLITTADRGRARTAVPLAHSLTGADLKVTWTAPVAATDDGLLAQPAAFDRVQLAADLAAAQALGLTSVRITVPVAELGAVPTRSSLLILRQVLDLAKRRGLRVEVTIDEAGTNREPRTWTQADRRLRAIVAALADHPALALWNIYQDPESSPTSDVQLRAWLTRAARAVHALDRKTPVTIGWQDPASAADPTMARLVDVVSVPWSGPPALLTGWLSRITAAADHRPLRLSLTAHSWNGIWPGGQTENEQAGWMATVLVTARTSGVSDVLAGPLRDGTAAAASLLPWVAGPAAHSGLVRADGQPKVVSRVFRSDYAGPFGPGRFPAIHHRFWWLAGVVTLLSVPGLPRRVVAGIPASFRGGIGRSLGRLTWSLGWLTGWVFGRVAGLTAQGQPFGWTLGWVLGRVFGRLFGLFGRLIGLFGRR